MAYQVVGANCHEGGPFYDLFILNCRTFTTFGRPQLYFSLSISLSKRQVQCTSVL